MSFLDELDVEEYAEGHEWNTTHMCIIDWNNPREDDRVRASCSEPTCDWEMWGYDCRPIGHIND